MVRSRQLFLRSRLELAAERDYTALGEIPTAAGSSREEYKSLLFYLACGGLRFLCVLPLLVVVYGMALGFTYFMSNEAMPHKFLLISSIATAESGGEDDDGGAWEGRVLDAEKRTKNIIIPKEAGGED